MRSRYVTNNHAGIPVRRYHSNQLLAITRQGCGCTIEVTSREKLNNVISILRDSQLYQADWVLPLSGRYDKATDRSFQGLKYRIIDA